MSVSTFRKNEVQDSDETGDGEIPPLVGSSHTLSPDESSNRHLPMNNHYSRETNYILYYRIIRSSNYIT